MSCAVSQALHVLMMMDGCYCNRKLGSATEVFANQLAIIRMPHAAPGNAVACILSHFLAPAWHAAVALDS